MEARRQPGSPYEALFAASLDAVLLTAPDGRILDANEAACRLFGRTREELLCLGRAGVVDPGDPRLAAALAERDRTGAYSGELRFRRGDGSTFLGEISSAVFTDVDGARRTSMVIRDVTERKEAEEAVRQLSGRMLRLQDEERRHLARELHDTLAQDLAGLVLHLDLLSMAVPEWAPAARQQLALVHQLAEQCAGGVRTLSYLLHPPLLDELGLADAVREYVDGFARRSGLRADLELPSSLEALPRETELALFRVLQEALANVHRHSGSPTVSVRIERTAGEIRLEVRDRGRGMEMTADEGEGRLPMGPLGVGILGMRERMRQLDGRLEIVSGASGTCVRAVVPVA